MTTKSFGTCLLACECTLIILGNDKQYLQTLCKFIIVFFDDILIYNKSFEEHLSHLEKAFRVLLEGKSFLKLSKCTFAQHQVEYFGHLVSEQGVESVQAKVQTTQQWPDPRSFKSLHGFLGLIGFYRYFIKIYATITTHLT